MFDWFISDTHFGHKNIIKYCNRPFSSVQEMDEIMIQNWNKVVKPNHKVLHLGDVYHYPKDEYKYLEMIRKLNGNITLILGNHDDGYMFGEYCSWNVKYWYKMQKHQLIFTHMPVHPCQFESYQSPIKDRYIKGFKANVHGHIHEKLINDPKYINISVEHTNYTPIHLDEIINITKRNDTI